MGAIRRRYLLAATSAFGLVMTVSPSAAYSPVYVWPEWLPPRDTPIDIVTPYGRFRMPIGYFAEPESLSLRVKDNLRHRDRFLRSRPSLALASHEGIYPPSRA